MSDKLEYTIEALIARARERCDILEGMELNAELLGYYDLVREIAKGREAEPGILGIAGEQSGMNATQRYKWRKIFKQSDIEGSECPRGMKLHKIRKQLDRFLASRGIPAEQWNSFNKREREQ